MSAGTQVLLLEASSNQATGLGDALRAHFPRLELEHIPSKDAYLSRLGAGPVDTVVSDGSVQGCERLKAFHQLRERHALVPFFYLSDWPASEYDPHGMRALGIQDFHSKADLELLAQEIRRALDRRALMPPSDQRLLEGYERLVTVVKDLSMVREMPEIMAIVRKAARELTGADGATFVIREGDLCHYADEDAIGPLWKGQKFPARACISGWAMMHQQPAVVEDIFHDPRIPVSAYEPTFVRSVAMVPIRSLDPIGAIGNYWAKKHLPDPREVRLLQALADTTAVAIENVRVRAELETRVRERTADLESFAYAISHDLRAPVRHMLGFAGMAIEDHAETMAPDLRKTLDGIHRSANRMGEMIEGMFELARMARTPVNRQRVDLGALAHDMAVLCRGTHAHAVDFHAPANLVVECDPVLLRIALQNLVANAWKFSSKQPGAKIEVGVLPDREPPVFYVRDNGAGFDAQSARNLFGLFQRFHAVSDFPGTGVGLATVHRVVQKHGGRLWAESAPGHGAAFFFTLKPGPKTDPLAPDPS